MTDKISKLLHNLYGGCRCSFEFCKKIYSRICTKHTNLLLFAYGILLSIAIIYTILSLSQFLATSPIKPLPGVIFYHHKTQYKLITYALMLPTLVLLWGGFLLILNKKNLEKIIRYFSFPLYSFCQLIGAVLLAFLCSKIKTAWVQIPLLICFFLPIYKLARKIDKVKFINMLFTLLSIALFVRFSTMFGEFVFKPLYVGNEFLDIPSTYSSSLSDSSNSYNLSDLQDVGTTDILHQSFIKLEKLTNPAYYINTSKNYSVLSTLGFIRGKELTRYIFQSSDNKLCLVEPLPLWALKELKTMVTLREYDQLKKLSKEFKKDREADMQKLEDVDSQKLLKYSSFQYDWQIFSRGFLHHHNHLFGSAYRFVLGQPLHEIFMQYGVLHTVGLGYILKALDKVSYSSYVHLYYSFYFIYFAAFLVILYILLRNRWYTLIGGILITAGWLAQTYLYLYLGPGTNPARYGMYLLVLLSIFYYAKTNRQIYMMGAILAALLAIAINTQFGLFVVISIIGVLLVEVLTKYKKESIRFEILTILFLIMGSACLVYYLAIGPEPIASYFFSGLLAFPFSTAKIINYFLVTSLIYGLLIWKWKTKDPLNYALLFMTFYSQGVYIYYLRSAGIYHFFAMSSIFILQLILAVFIMQKTLPRKGRTLLCAVCIFMSLLAIFSAQRSFHKSRKNIRHYFKKHELYKWDLPGTGFMSTMNPSYFKDSIQLIEKYKSAQGIYMLSQYDNFLPLLAKTYNKLPFIDLQWYLITQKEFDLVVDTIKTSRPEYLFVENGLLYNHAVQVIPANMPVVGHLHEESLWRAERLNLLGNIFKQVKSDYVPVESSYLLTVYKLKQ